MDAVIGMSGFFAASSLLWIGAGLLVAFVIGAIVMSVFGGIFFGLHRAAKVVSRRFEPQPVPVRRDN